MPIRPVERALFRKGVNSAVARLARAKKLNTTKRNGTGGGAVEFDFRGETRELNAKQHLAIEMAKRRRGLKGLTRVLSNQRVTERLVRMKRFKARKAKKMAKFD
jgi:hypothetical protein